VNVQPLTVTISRSPSGDIYVGDEVTVSASTNSSSTFNYAWTVDGNPVSGNSPNGPMVIAWKSGTITFGVTISNDYAQASAMLPVDVKPLSVIVTSQPAANIFVGDPVTFSASLTGNSSNYSYTYAWTVDGTPVSGQNSSYLTSFALPGNHTVDVVASRGPIQASGSLMVVVKPHLPDLSSSHIAVNPASITNLGETLTYTLSLHNTGLVSANAALNDPIPAHTALVAGSPSASDGGAVTLQAGALQWAGTIPAAGSVTVTYQVTVLPTLQIGDKVINTATLEDGFGTSTPLVVESLYNPYFTLSIQNGDLYTNHNPVTLSYTWDSSKAITYVQFSNDGGFGLGPNTSAWIAVNQANPTLPTWTLAVMENTIMPRTVYARFKDSGSTIYGPISDDIIFDAVPPQVAKVEILPGGNLAPASGSSVIVRVTTSDDNSGVATIQLSNDLVFTNPTEFAANVGVTDIPWVLSASGKVFVRVSDRAGNASTIHTELGPIVQVYLPAVKR
jgi:uncharacterized repeat protein (TIGR01451 family)